jgi:hypothetical protein
MRIEELDNSNSLEPGQLLSVLKCWRFCGNAAVYHLQQSVKSGLLQFYRHRRGACSRDSPVEELQIIPSPENNE